MFEVGLTDPCRAIWQAGQAGEDPGAIRGLHESAASPRAFPAEARSAYDGEAVSQRTDGAAPPPPPTPPGCRRTVFDSGVCVYETMADLILFSRDLTHIKSIG